MLVFTSGSMFMNPKNIKAWELIDQSGLRGFRINDEYHLYDHGQVLPKNKTYYLQNDFRFEYSNEIKYVSILLQDMFMKEPLLLG